MVVFSLWWPDVAIVSEPPDPQQLLHVGKRAGCFRQHAFECSAVRGGARRGVRLCLERPLAIREGEPQGRYTCMDTTAALAAGTSTLISRPDECTSLVAGAHTPNSSTLAPPSVMPALASGAGLLRLLCNQAVGAVVQQVPSAAVQQVSSEVTRDLTCRASRRPRLNH